MMIGSDMSAAARRLSLVFAGFWRLLTTCSSLHHATRTQHNGWYQSEGVHSEIGTERDWH